MFLESSGLSRNMLIQSTSFCPNWTAATRIVLTWIMSFKRRSMTRRTCGHHFQDVHVRPTEKDLRIPSRDPAVSRQIIEWQQQQPFFFLFLGNENPFFLLQKFREKKKALQNGGGAGCLSAWIRNICICTYAPFFYCCCATPGEKKRERTSGWAAHYTQNNYFKVVKVG